MQQTDLEERLIEFADLIIELSESLPATKAANHLSSQLIRSGTASALNYGEAQAAESKQDFLHKIKIVLKELRETQINLKIIARRRFLLPAFEKKALDECGQLVAIFTKTVETTKRNM
ncbi:MAG: four helix bundle protein [Lewinellaceae bacterium]|nr:four helix bundle protein [Saprospiraceae bacterium]MCB9331709.1 four helix bundle protein [Lewinellaceae bacterium]